MDGKQQGAPAEGEREARARAALQANLARRKAQAHARRQPEQPPHAAPDQADPGEGG